ncbi:MAG: hypothetical protein V4581_09860 [Bacteroidota bacterium]
MKPEIINYINTYYRHLRTLAESKAERHIYNFPRVKDEPAGSSKRKILEEKGWISNDPEVLKLLDKGPDFFYDTIAKRIFDEHRNKIFFNNCPKCGSLARTPLAKQCRHCFYAWHDK